MAHIVFPLDSDGAADQLFRVQIEKKEQYDVLDLDFTQFGV